MDRGKPVLFVTGHVPASRVGAFEALHARRPIELALFGGRHLHAAAPVVVPARLPARQVAQRDLGALVSSGRYRAVIVGTGGRVALPLAWRAARRTGVPFIFWAALWRTPRTAAHIAAVPLMRQIYRHADAVVTYGPHVGAFVAGHGARRIYLAPQAVDNDFWGESVPASPATASAAFGVLFVGRADRAKGLDVLLDAWRMAGFGSDEATLTVVGAGVEGGAGVRSVGQADAAELRDLYGACDVLVIPSIRTRRFLEPWGLVVNEAMNQRAAIIASDAVGAAAGGLVRHERNGLVVPAGDRDALAGALRALAGNHDRCQALGETGRSDVAAYTYERWADGFVDALDACTGSVAL
jgi:glycosyltransferase involved in cell wall biosynthesis